MTLTLPPGVCPDENGESERYVTDVVIKHWGATITERGLMIDDHEQRLVAIEDTPEGSWRTDDAAYTRRLRELHQSRLRLILHASVQ